MLSYLQPRDDTTNTHTKIKTRWGWIIWIRLWLREFFSVRQDFFCVGQEFFSIKLIRLIAVPPLTTAASSQHHHCHCIPISTAPPLPLWSHSQHCNAATAIAIMSDRDGDGDADASMTCWGPKKRKGKMMMSDLDLLHYYETKLGSGSSWSRKTDCLRILDDQVICSTDASYLVSFERKSKG